MRVDRPHLGADVLPGTRVRGRVAALVHDERLRDLAADGGAASLEVVERQHPVLEQQGAHLEARVPLECQNGSGHDGGRVLGRGPVLPPDGGADGVEHLGGEYAALDPLWSSTPAVSAFVPSRAAISRGF